MDKITTKRVTTFVPIIMFVKNDIFNIYSGGVNIIRRRPILHGVYGVHNRSLTFYILYTSLFEHFSVYNIKKTIIQNILQTIIQYLKFYT